MLMSILSHILSAWFAFLLPCYSTFKALSHRPLSEPDLQRWSMYWTVIGAFVAFEYVAEWLISWLPFYWEVKTLFLLFLALPQTQGSTYIYNTHLQPFFAKNETDLDAGIICVQRNILTFLQTHLFALWGFVWNILNKTPASDQPPAPGTGQPQTSPSAGLSLESAMGLWRTYGPSVMNALQLSAKSSPVSTSASTSPPSPAAPTASSSSFQSASAERRAPQTPDSGTSLPNPYAAPAALNPSAIPPPFPEPQLT